MVRVVGVVCRVAVVPSGRVKVEVFGELAWVGFPDQGAGKEVWVAPVQGGGFRFRFEGEDGAGADKDRDLVERERGRSRPLLQ